MHTVDLSTVYTALNEALLTLLTGAAGIAVAYLKVWLQNHAKFLSEQTDTELANGLNRALQNGVQIAMQQTGDLETKYPGIPVKSQIAAWAGQYAADHSPSAMLRFTGMTPNDLALKALAYVPPVLQVVGDGTIAPSPIPVQVEPLPPLPVK